MRVTDIFTAAAIAAQYTEVASNRIPLLGEGLFPARKKMGLDLAMIKAHKGLNVHLAPSNFDAKSTLRARGKFSTEKMEMAFFRESMLVSERDEQEFMRILDANDPYAADIMRRLFDDSNTLIDAANVVPEIMRMQLLCPSLDAGSPSIFVSSNDGVVYQYNYDPEGTYKANNYIEIADAAWNTPAASTPLADIRTAQDKVESISGTRPTLALMNRTTFTKMMQSEEVRGAILAQNVSANIFMSDAVAKQVLGSSLGVTPVIYDKVYMDHEGNTQKYYKDGFVTLMPAGALGITWYGVTPEERSVPGTTIVNTGVTVSVTQSTDPVNTKTTVSEIVLPSFERMNETAVLKVF